MKKLILSLVLLIFLSNFVFAQTSDAQIVSISLINQDPDPARAGEIVELRFRVENLGGKEVNDLEVKILPEYPFTLVPGEEDVKDIRTLAGYQKGEDAVIIKFKLRVDKDAVKGQNEIKIRYRKGGESSYTSITFNIDVTSREFAQIIYLDKSKLDPGKETKMVFTIYNVGSAPLQNLVFSWNEADGVVLPVHSDDTRYIKYIDVGKSTDLEYTVVADVNAVAGLYQLNLNLKFEAENGTSKEINTKAGVFVGGETDFDVTFSESSAGQTSLSVANIGNNPALSVTVRIPEQQGFRVTGSTSSIIGNLDKGDYTIVSFQIMGGSMTQGGMDRTQTRGLSEEERQKLMEQFSRDASQNNLEVLIEYTDTTGVRRAVEKTVPIQFRSFTDMSQENSHGGQMGAYGRQQSIWPKIIGPIITLIIVVGGIVFYRKIKFAKRKRK